MGSLKSVYGDAYNTNYENPATLTNLLNATYEGGVYAKYADVSSVLQVNRYTVGISVIFRSVFL